MASLRERLGARRLLVADGAWGTQLQERGLAAGECPELWNATRPQEVRAVAEGYLAAGSDLILTNTFGGSALMLRRHGLEERTAELNAAGARLSLEAVSATGGQARRWERWATSSFDEGTAGLGVNSLDRQVPIP